MNLNKDAYKIGTKNSERKITLQKICDIAEIPLPAEFSDIKDDIISSVGVQLSDVEKESCVFKLANLENGGQELARFLPKAVKKGVKVVFADAAAYEEVKTECKQYPCIPVDDIIESSGKFFSYVKNINNVKTVAVTGTCGKTTTMHFLRKIVPKKFKTYMNKGNANSYFSVARHIMNELTADKQVYLQEVGAAKIDSVRKAAAMLNVDAFILSNVFNHHMNMYGTVENILKDKTSFDDYMKPEGVVIANYDDERIAGYEFKHKVITFGINTERKVDYRASNIIQNGQYLELDVEYEGRKTHISTAILGEQNAYNVLAAFALSRWLDINEKTIVKGFDEYESRGIRQNFREIGGYKVLIDCYNICEDSLKTNIETAGQIDIDPGKKRVAVITGENKLGEDSEKISYEMGKNLDFSKFDHVICVGTAEETPKNLDYCGNGRAVYEGILSTGNSNVTYVTDTKSLTAKMREILEPGDMLLVKGIYTLDLVLAIDELMGTAIGTNNPYYTNKAKLVEDDNFSALKIKYLKGVDIIESKKKSGCITIPDSIDGYPVYSIGRKLYKTDIGIRKVDFGHSVQNIGRYAFLGCIGLRQIRIPGNVKVIDKGAFMLCVGLRKVIIEEGVTHIEKNAFKGCFFLSEVVIPDSVKYIDKSAFDDCHFVKIKKIQI